MMSISTTAIVPPSAIVGSQPPTNRSASPTRLRVRHLAGRIHALGPGPLFHLFCELVDGAEPLSRLEVYARLDADFIRAFNGHELHSQLFVARGLL
jgi:hypothetical protein